jgi:hypothetical protein
MTEDGNDIVARLERLATKMFQSGDWGADLETVKAAMDTIVDLRVDLHRATEEAELEAKLAKAMEALDAVMQHDASFFYGPSAEKNMRASWRGVMRKVRSIVAMISCKSH